MQERSRQDRTRELLDNFIKGHLLMVSKLVMSLYPKEVDRFKREFPSLSFKVVKAYKTYTGKQYEVHITRK